MWFQECSNTKIKGFIRRLCPLGLYYELILRMIISKIRPLAGVFCGCSCCCCVVSLSPTRGFLLPPPLPPSSPLYYAKTAHTSSSTALPHSPCILEAYAPKIDQGCSTEHPPPAMPPTCPLRCQTLLLINNYPVFHCRHFLPLLSKPVLKLLQTCVFHVRVCFCLPYGLATWKAGGTRQRRLNYLHDVSCEIL